MALCSSIFFSIAVVADIIKSNGPRHSSLILQVYRILLAENKSALGLSALMFHQVCKCDVAWQVGTALKVPPPVPERLTPAK